MPLQKIRKTGNSYVVTIPKEEMARQNLREGDLVVFEVRKASLMVEMDPEVRAAFERSLELYADDYDYLAKN